MNKNWCAVCAFPGKQRFVFGTASLPVKDGEEFARREILRLLEATFLAIPEIVSIIPGEIVFVDGRHGKAAVANGGAA